MAYMYTEKEIERAQQNYENQETLANTLKEIFRQSGKTSKQFGEEFGVSKERFENIINGEEDLHLSELRMLATALNVIIIYDVTTD